MTCLSCFCLFAMCILCMCLCMFRCVWMHMWVQVHPCGIQILILSVLLSQFLHLNPELNNLASLRRQLATRVPCLCLLYLRVIGRSPNSTLGSELWSSGIHEKRFTHWSISSAHTWYFVAQNQVFILVQRTAYQLSHLPVPC